MNQSESPTLRVLSLGAGVQSTAILLLAAEGRLPKLDAAIFSDTGWEPKSVYDHLNRLDEEVAKPAGIPIYRVSAGNIRDDALNPEARFASMPLYIKNPDGSDGMSRRQCTSEYKIKPIKEQVRRLLGAEEVDGKVGRVQKGKFVEQWIGISMDEWHRAKSSDVGYAKHHFPLLYDIQMDREACIRYLDRVGWGTTPKSACIGCPFHGNRMWRQLRDENPAEWEDAVAFDSAIRKGNARAIANGDSLRGEAFLHRSRLPLSIAPIDRVSRKERLELESPLFDLYTDEEELAGCSPFGCRTDEVDKPWFVNEFNADEDKNET